MQISVQHLQTLLNITLLSYLIWQRYHRQLKNWWSAMRKRSKAPRQLRPRSPLDCRECRVDHLLGTPLPPNSPPRWQDIKSNRGRPHASLAGTLQRRTTPAMATGITDHVWSVREFVLTPVY